MGSRDAFLSISRRCKITLNLVNCLDLHFLLRPPVYCFIDRVRFSGWSKVHEAWGSNFKENNWRNIHRIKHYHDSELSNVMQFCFVCNSVISVFLT